VGTVRQCTVCTVDAINEFQKVILKLYLVVDIGMVPDIVGTQIGIHGPAIPGNQNNTVLLYQLLDTRDIQLMIACIAMEIIDHRITFL